MVGGKVEKMVLAAPFSQCGRITVKSFHISHVDTGQRCRGV